MTKLTSRDRVMRTVTFKEADRVPMDFGGSISSTITIRAYDNLKKHLQVNTPTKVMEVTFQLAEIEEVIFRKMKSDVRPIYGRPPSNAYKFKENGQFIDEWGITFTPASGGLYYENISPPLREASLNDLDEYGWPDPYDKQRVKGLREEGMRLRESPYAIVGAPYGFSRIFEQAWQLRGMEELLMDMVANQAFVHALFRKITDVQKARWTGFLDAVGPYVDIVRVGDDVAMQTGPIMSPKMYRKLLKPYHKELFKLIKEKADVKLLYHCCGGVSDLVEDFIEIGVDILNPVQVSAAGMDGYSLKERFADQIVFWGGVDSQHILPKGSTEEVRSEVRKRIRQFAPGGGYVLCAVHNLQADVPAENILAMYNEAYNFGNYPIDHR